MKKRQDQLEQEIHKPCKITEIIEKEDDDDVEIAFKELIAAILIAIDDSLHTIRFVLFGLLGFILGSFIYRLF